MRIQGKVILFFTVFFVLLLSQGAFFIAHEQTIFQREMEEKGVILAENLAELSKEPLMNYQFGRLINQIESIKGKTDISYISIVNEHYMVLADTRKNLEGWTYSGTLVSSTKLDFGRNMLVVQAPVYILDVQRGMVEIAFALDVLNKKIRENIFIFLLFFFFEVLAAVLFAIVFEFQLVRPLDHLAKAVIDVTPDSLIHPIGKPVHSSVEIKRVSRAIDQMKTNLKQAHEEIISKTKLATMGKLAANFAHEIRNPLEAISGSVEILSYDVEYKSEKASYLSIIREEISNLNDYLENFLEFTRVEPVQLSSVDVNRAVNDTLLLLRPLCSKKNVMYDSNLKEGLPVCLADLRQLKRVLLNIILNSIESFENNAKKREKKINISTDVVGEHVNIEVADSGAGIEKDVRDKIFDPYFSTKANGFGIGLAISKRIIEQHKGRIVILDSSKAGTRMRISLPVHEVEFEEEYSNS